MSYAEYPVEKLFKELEGPLFLVASRANDSFPDYDIDLRTKEEVTLMIGSDSYWAGNLADWTVFSNSTPLTYGSWFITFFGFVMPVDTPEQFNDCRHRIFANLEKGESIYTRLFQNFAREDDSR